MPDQIAWDDRTDGGSVLPDTTTRISAIEFNQVKAAVNTNAHELGVVQATVAATTEPVASTINTSPITVDATAGLMFEVTVEAAGVAGGGSTYVLATPTGLSYTGRNITLQIENESTTDALTIDFDTTWYTADGTGNQPNVVIPANRSAVIIARPITATEIRVSDAIVSVTGPGSV